MTASCPIYAPLKRVSIPGLCTSFEINPVSKAVNVATRQLEFRSKEHRVSKLNNLVLQFQKLNENHWNTIDNLNVELSSMETQMPLLSKNCMEKFLQCQFFNIRECNISNFDLSANIEDPNLTEMLLQSTDFHHQPFM